MISSEDKRRLINVLKKSFKKFNVRDTIKNLKDPAIGDYCSICPLSCENTNHIWHSLGIPIGCSNRSISVLDKRIYACTDRVLAFANFANQNNLMNTE